MTVASINQHCFIDSGSEHETVDSLTQTKTHKRLPGDYTEILPVHLPAYVFPAKNNLNPVVKIPFNADVEEDKMWLDESDQPSWTLFHARRETQIHKLKEAALLPIW